MKTALLIISIVLFAAAAVAQPALHWQHIYGDSLSQDMTAGAVRLLDGDIILVGEVSNETPLLFDINLTRMTVDGDSVWMRSHEENNTQHARACTLTPDGNIAVAGSYNYEEGNEWYINCLLHVFDSEANLLWSWYEHVSANTVALAITNTLDGGFILTGYYQENGIPNVETDVYTVRIGANGSTQWTVRTEFLGREEAHAVTIHPDGYILVAGQTRVDEVATAWDAFSLQLDGDGNELGGQVHEFEQYDNLNEYIYDIHITPNGFIYFAGEANHPAGPQRMNDGYLMLTNQDYELIDRRFYGGTGFDGIRRIEPMPGSDLMLAGYSASYTANFDRDLWAVHVNAMGWEQWDYWVGRFGDTGEDKGYGLIPIEGQHETQYIITGNSSPEGQVGNKNVIAVRFSARAPFVEIDLVPVVDDTIDIPAEGGSFEFTVQLINNLRFAIAPDAWAAVYGPDNLHIEPMRLHTIYIRREHFEEYDLIQDFPAEYVPGIYHYIGRLGRYPNTVVAADTLILRKLEE